MHTCVYMFIRIATCTQSYPGHWTRLQAILYLLTVQVETIVLMAVLPRPSEALRSAVFSERETSILKKRRSWEVPSPKLELCGFPIMWNVISCLRCVFSTQMALRCTKPRVTLWDEDFCGLEMTLVRCIHLNTLQSLRISNLLKIQLLLLWIRSERPQTENYPAS